MKIKTISKIILKKVEDWIGSIEDKDLAKDVKSKVIVTGGCIASMLQSEKVNDFDIYFEDKKITERIALYYVEIANETYDSNLVVFNDDDRISISDTLTIDEGEVEEFEGQESSDSEKDYSPIHLSENAITLKGDVQLIIRFFGKPDEIHKNYDFIHCTNYWTFNTKLVTNKPALESILTKELHYVGSLYPICSIIRTRKFVGRGWRIHAGQYLKMCFQVSLLNLSDLKVLREQLVGVDSLYFHKLITALSQKQEGDQAFKINNEYLSEIIDRIFN